ncbi:helix-turn-helix domain-containing protein [Methylocystis hirsuta]|uniref:Uncharacterized protein n=1 Tax=Methylocystis hirsuta TaxID=369798 RepID=A0A3M9XNC8_9HYPH|nr:helix-turn-helix domain-containing protein [Methylocystis hirsuta]RNJ48380.1 hypothetical protein D1O30_00810 [Methylocystis hirsuta]
MIDDRAFRPNTLGAIGKAGARFRSLGDAGADTTTAHGRLLLTFLGGIAEFERDSSAPSRAKAARAKARGVHMGRPPALTPHQRAEALRDLAKGNATQADIARQFKLSRSTISRLA